jgi:pimeloyl-ACP methyl ester carboxylesterase
MSVVCPKEAAPGKPWMWRSGMFWKAIPKFHDTDLKLVEQGYHVVLAAGHVYGHPKGNAVIDAAYDLLTTEYGFSNKCSMASMSRETTALFRWAYTHPERVESIYVDNGVCNLRSWPGGKLVPGSTSRFRGHLPSWEGLKKAYGFTSDEEALAGKISPIDLLEPLAEAGVPILTVCGSKDTCCIYEEHDAILEERYRKLGGDIIVIIEDKGHSHGMRDPTPVLEFIRMHTSADK